MTKEEKNEIKYRMKRLARKFCRRNNVYERFDDSVAKLIEKSYFSAYLLCLHENKNKIVELENRVAELEAQIEEMKCCANCKFFQFQNVSGYYTCIKDGKRNKKNYRSCEFNLEKWESRK